MRGSRRGDTKRVAGAEFGDCTEVGQCLDRFALESLDEIHCLKTLIFSLRTRGRFLPGAPMALDQVRPP